jgi:ketosteroid isomerase-like protein
MDDTATIQSTVVPWTRACLDRDWDSLLALCTPDVVFSPPGEPSVSGGSLRPWLGAFPKLREFAWNFDHLEIHGDFAVGVGAGSWTVEIDGKPVPMSFKFVDLFRRGDDGTWRYSHVFWSLNQLLSAL